MRRGEFTQLGFTVRCSLQLGVDSRDFDELLDRFILDAVEANDLYCGGGGDPTGLRFFVYGNGRRSATEADREHVEDWLKAQSAVTSVCVGTLEDAWHGDDEVLEEPHGEHAA